MGMLGNVFLTFYRTTIRHPLYTALTLLGLGFGIAVFVVIALAVRYEISFESWIPGVERIHEVQRSFLGLGSGAQDIGYETQGGLLDDLQLDGTRVWDKDLTVHRNGRSTREKEELVDDGFFRLFDLPLIAGDRDTALAPGRILLTEAMARRYFGAEPAMGKTLTLTDDEGTQDFVISAVLRTPPANTDLRFDFVRLISPQRIERMKSDWRDYNNGDLHTFLSLSQDQARQLNAEFDHIVDIKADRQMRVVPAHKVLRLRARSLREIHLEYSKGSVLALGLVGIATFLIAAINYINLATVRAGMRAKEVAMRKVLGASQGALRGQFLGESLLTSVISGLIGLSFVELSLPLVNRYGGLALALDYRQDAMAFAALLAVVLGLGFLAGLYPAFLLSGFRPASVLSSARMPAGGKMAGRVREALVVAQFSAVIVFFIVGLGVVSQIRHLETADVGFQREGLLLTSSTVDPAMTSAEIRAFTTVLRGMPGVTGVAGSEIAPGADGTYADQTAIEGTDAKGFWIGDAAVSDDFFTIYGAKLLAGRFFDRAYAEDEFVRSTRMTNVVLNESAVNALGISDPQMAIGKVIYIGIPDNRRRIIGVVGNSRFFSPRQKVAPTVFYFMPAPEHPFTSIRYVGGDERVLRARIAQAWHEIAPEIPFEIEAAVDTLDKYYKPDRDRSHLFTLGALAAALISCIGLYGLAAFSTSQRVIEIGLRKVLGATSGAVVRLLIGQFLRPVVLAGLIAAPVGYLILDRWLKQFDDRVPVTLAPLLLSMGTATAVAVVTVGLLAWRAAGTEPGRALRNE